MKIDEKTIGNMQTELKDNMIVILKNSLNEKKRAVKVTEKTKELRPEFVKNNLRRKKQLLAVIENIEGMQTNKEITEQQREYIMKLEDLVPTVIEEIIFEEWINKKKVSVIDKDCKNVLRKLKDTREFSGKVIEVEKICKYIEQRLFLELVECKNTFWGYFINAINFFEKIEDKESVENYTGAILRQPVIMATPDIKVDVIRKNIDLHENNWIEYYEKNVMKCLLNPAEYINYILTEAREQYRENQKGSRIIKYLDGFMLTTMIGRFGIAGGYTWAIENWGKFFVNFTDLRHQNEAVQFEKIFFKLGNKPDYSGLNSTEAEAIIIQRNIFSQQVMEQWLLFTLLDRLISDDISMLGQNSVNIQEKGEYCVALSQKIERNESAILNGSQILKVALNKQNRTGYNAAEKNAYYIVYEPQQGCLRYLLSDGEEGAKRIFSFGKYKSPRESQSFRNMYQHFEEIHQFQNNRKKNYGDDFYLNQFIHLDSAVEIFYGISRMLKVTQKTAKNLEREIIILSNAIVSAQRKIKCGIGKMLHDCFEFYISIKSEGYTEEECGEKLVQLAGKIQKIVFDLKVEEVQMDFQRKILELNWETTEKTIKDIINSEVFELVHIDFSQQDYVTTLSYLMKNYIMSADNRKIVNDKIREGLYKNEIAGITENVRNRWKDEIADRLQISKEAWVYTSNCFPELQGESGRDKNSCLYKEIQHALINANYE